MRKKLKDFTLEELSNLCKRTNCPQCPFRGFDARCDLINVSEDVKLDTEGTLAQLESII